MSYTGARVGEALSRGFSNIGDALYQAAQNKQRRKEYEATVAENQKRYEDAQAWQQQQAAAREREFSYEIEQDRRREAEARRAYIDQMRLKYGPGSVVQRSGSLVGPGGKPVEGTGVSAYSVNPAGADPTQTWDYRQEEALGELKNEQFIERSDAMASRGRTNSGAPIRPAGEPEPNTFTLHGREFANTPEGVRESLAWREEYANAGRKPGTYDAIRALLGGEQPMANDNAPQPNFQIPEGEATASAQEPWKNDPLAVQAIQQIQASALLDDEKQRRIAEVKRRAGG